MTAALIAAIALAITGWGAFLVAAIGGNAIRDDLLRRINTAVALWKQAEVDKAALADEVRRLRSGLPRDVFVDLNFERVLRVESTVGQLDEDSESWSWPGDPA